MNKKVTCLFIVFLSFFASKEIFAQLSLNSTTSPTQLVEKVLLGYGVKASNITFTGNSNLSKASFVYKDIVGATNLGLSKGVLLSTGNVLDAIGPNLNSSTGIQGSGVQDKELDSIISKTGKQTNDAVVLEFDFIPQSDSINFEYVFASEEYPEFNCSSFNDIFGFFLSGPNPFGGMYQMHNLAIVPGTNGTNVSINSINSGNVSKKNNPVICDNIDPNWRDYSKYFIVNEAFDPTSTQIGFDGFTKPLKARAKVICGQKYHLKIALADVGDQNYDSGVFLLGGSLSSNVVAAEVKQQNFSGLIVSDTNLVEGCSKGVVTFKIPQKINSNTVINYKISGTAANGTDVKQLSSSVIIPANSDSVQLIIDPIKDNVDEGSEVITITYNPGGCSGEISKSFTIFDKPLLPNLNFKYDSILCLNSTVTFPTKDISFTKGGLYTANSSDISVNKFSGRISMELSKIGTYDITYTLTAANVCEVGGTKTVSVTIKQPKTPTTGFKYEKFICGSIDEKTLEPILGTDFSTGGTFSANKELKVDPVSGKLDVIGMKSGDYTVYYEIKEVSCLLGKKDSTKITLISSGKPLPSFSYPSPICLLSATKKFTPTKENGFENGGTFEFVSGVDNSLVINKSTGVIDISNCKRGTYTVVYRKRSTVDCGRRSPYVDIILIDNTPKNIDFTYDTLLCIGGANKSPNLSTDFAKGGLFTSSSTLINVNKVNGKIDMSSGVIGKYDITYTYPQTECGAEISKSFNFRLEQLTPQFSDFSYNTPVCKTLGTITPTKGSNFVAGGVFSSPINVVTSSGTGKIFLSSSQPGEYEISYKLSAIGCLMENVSKAKIVIETPTPNSNFSYKRPICINDKNALPNLPVDFTKGGRFSTLSSVIKVDSLTGLLDLKNVKADETYPIKYSITSKVCGTTTSGTTEVLISGLRTPNVSFSYPVTKVCSGTSEVLPKLDSRFEAGGEFSNSTGLNVDQKSGKIDVANSPIGKHSVKYILSEQLCVAQNSKTVDFTIAPKPNSTILAPSKICLGDTFLLIADTTASSFVWTGPNNFKSTSAKALLENVNVNQSGEYSVNLKTGDCTNIGKVTIRVDQFEKIQIQPIGPFCSYDTTKYTIISNTNGVWNNVSGLIPHPSDSSKSIFNPSKALTGVSKVKLISKVGCGGDGEIDVVVNPLPSTDFSISDNFGCKPFTFKLSNHSSQLSDSLLFEINSNQLKVKGSSQVSHVINDSGCYSLKITNYSKGCFSSQMKDNVVCVDERPIADFDVNKKELDVVDPVVRLTNKSSKASNYKWFLGDGFISLESNPIYRYKEEAETYKIVLVAYRGNSCMDTIIKEINIPDKFSIYVPNTFTPNQDKSNEIFYPVISKAIISDSYEFKIYDRWGELVFESRDRTKGWNGFYGNKLAPDGTYIWKLSVIDDVSKARKEFIGHVNLLK